MKFKLENAIQKNVGLYSPCVFNLEGISYLHKQHEESKKRNFLEILF